MKINPVALYMAMLSSLSVDGFNFRSSDPTAADADVSTILERLTSLEDTIVSLHKTVESQGNQILNQQRQIEVLESNVKSGRSLMDDECFLSFFNETGTPECKVNYQLSADHGFYVNGTTTFDGSVDFVDGSVTFHQNAEVLVLSPTRFDDDVLFEDSATFTDDVNFLDTVDFREDANVTFRGFADFVNQATFDEHVYFKDDVAFLDEVEFHDDVLYGRLSDVTFLDTVTFKDHVTIDGPSGRRKIRFRVKDNVEVEFKTDYDIDFETEVNFYKDVHIKAKECRRSGKGYGKGCSSDDDHPPELFVDGDATFESDVRIDNDLHVDTILPDHASEVSIPNLHANTLSATTISSTTINARSVNSAVMSVTGAVSAASVAATGSISAASLSATGNIESTAGSLIADINVDAGQNVTAGANVIAGGNQLNRRGLQVGSTGLLIGFGVQVDNVNGVSTADIESAVSMTMEQQAALPSEPEQAESCSCIPDLASLADKILTVAGLNVTGDIYAASLDAGSGSISAGLIEATSYSGITFPDLNASEILTIIKEAPQVSMASLQVISGITADTISASGYTGLPSFDGGQVLEFMANQTIVAAGLDLGSGSLTAGTVSASSVNALDSLTLGGQSVGVQSGGTEITPTAFNGTQVLEFLADQDLTVNSIDAGTYNGLDIEFPENPSFNGTQVLEFLKTQDIEAASVSAADISATTSLTVGDDEVLTDFTPAAFNGTQVLEFLADQDLTVNSITAGTYNGLDIEFPENPSFNGTQVLEFLKTQDVEAASVSAADISATTSLTVGDDEVLTDFTPAAFNGTQVLEFLVDQDLTVNSIDAGTYNGLDIEFPENASFNGTQVLEFLKAQDIEAASVSAADISATISLTVGGDEVLTDFNPTAFNGTQVLEFLVNQDLTVNSIDAGTYNGLDIEVPENPSFNGTQVLEFLKTQDIEAASVSAADISATTSLTVGDDEVLTDFTPAAFNGTQVLEFLVNQDLTVNSIDAGTYNGLDIEFPENASFNGTQVLEFLKAQDIEAASLNVGSGSLSAGIISAQTSLTLDGDGVITEANNECVCTAETFEDQMITVGGLTVVGNAAIIGNMTIEEATNNEIAVPLSGGYLSVKSEVSSRNYEGLPPLGLSGEEVLEFLVTADVEAASISASSIFIDNVAVTAGGGNCECSPDVFESQVISVGGIESTGTISAPLILVDGSEVLTRGGGGGGDDTETPPT